MRMKTGVGEALALIFPEKPTVAENYVINLVPGAASVEPVPFLLRLLAFPATNHR